MARFFNGTTDFIDTTLQMGTVCPGGASSSLGSFVLSAWVMLTSSSISFPSIIAPSTGDTFNIDFGINVGHFAGLNLYFSGLESQNVASFSLNSWHHVACRYTSNGSANGTITVYDNGVDVTVGNQSATGYAGTDTNHVQIANIGAGNNRWKGNIADVAIWTAATQVNALSVAQIVALSNGARPLAISSSNLLGWWPLDGLQSPEPDLGGLANNGTLTGTAPAFGPPIMQFTPLWPQPPSVAAATIFPFQVEMGQTYRRITTISY